MMMITTTTRHQPVSSSSHAFGSSKRMSSSQKTTVFRRTTSALTSMISSSKRTTTKSSSALGMSAIFLGTKSERNNHHHHHHRNREVYTKRVQAKSSSEDDEEEIVKVSSDEAAKSSKFFNNSVLLGAAMICGVLITSLLMPEASLAKSKAAVVSAATSATTSSFSFQTIIDWVIHLDKHLVELFTTSGKMAYGVLFAIIFAETGFVVTPFLPGDSLLFACGALGALGVLNFPLCFGLLFTAAILGDTVNYMCGSLFGEVAIKNNPKIFKPDYIAKTRTFYDKYGGRTVVLARFFVIVRTFAPFIAGVAKMNYKKFALYNVIGASVWVTSFMGLGFFFGNVPVVKENFATTIVIIILLSLVPIIFEVINHKKESKKA